MKKSILDVIKEDVLNYSGYSFKLEERVDEDCIIIHFESKCVYQTVFERLLQVTPLLQKLGYRWQVYIDLNLDLSIMLF